MDINFTAPSTSSDPNSGGSSMLDRVIGFIAAAFTRIEQFSGRPFGYPPLDKNALIPTKFEGTGTADGTTILFGDQTWKPASSVIADGDHGDIIVSGGGTVFTVDELPESRIDGLVDDLSMGLSDTEELQRKFRLLLKRHFELFNDIPPGLEDEIPLALATD